MVLKSIGYKSVPVDGLPFDLKKGELIMDAPNSVTFHTFIVNSFYIFSCGSLNQCLSQNMLDSRQMHTDFGEMVCGKYNRFGNK